MYSRSRLKKPTPNCSTTSACGGACLRVNRCEAGGNKDATRMEIQVGQRVRRLRRAIYQEEAVYEDIKVERRKGIARVVVVPQADLHGGHDGGVE